MRLPHPPQMEEAEMCVPGCQEMLHATLNRRGFFKGAAAAGFAAAVIEPAEAAKKKSKKAEPDAGAKAPDDFGRYLAWGFTLVVVLQALLNISVALALLPTKGIPLPFISYGGSSLVVTMTACGVLLNLSQHG